MPQGRRIALTVQLNLDPVPGTFHDEEDARRQVQWILDQAIPMYFPGVAQYQPPLFGEPTVHPLQAQLPYGD